MNSARNQTLEQARKPVRGRGCLISVAVIALLLLLGAVRISRPRFVASVPDRIEVRATQFDGGEDYSAHITAPNDCRSVIALFERGTWTMPCMCKEFVSFKIHSQNGSVEYIDLLPGHSGPESCQIRRGLWHYGLSRKDFGRIIAEAGFDEAKVFAYEGLQYSGDATATKNQAEQAGTGQPATRPESKSGGSDKPQPESEGRSR
jgi:hypothetical protein